MRINWLEPVRRFWHAINYKSIMREGPHILKVLIFAGILEEKNLVRSWVSNSYKRYLKLINEVRHHFTKVFNCILNRYSNSLNCFFLSANPVCILFNINSLPNSKSFQRIIKKISLLHKMFTKLFLREYLVVKVTTSKLIECHHSLFLELLIVIKCAYALVLVKNENRVDLEIWLPS